METGIVADDPERVSVDAADKYGAHNDAAIK